VTVYKPLRRVLIASLLALVSALALAQSGRVYIHDATGNLKEVLVVDLENDPANCGTYKNVCPTGRPLCDMGVCHACDPRDSDCDGIPDSRDNCPHVKNRLQEDSDHDGVGDACDNCPTVANADQLNTDGAADGGDACDPDDDNDLCPDGVDDRPKEDSSIVGWRLAANCPDASQKIYGWDGADTDGDGLRNCQDPDDDNDGVPDVDDPCPLVAGTDSLLCQSPPTSCPATTLLNTCQFGGCNEFLLRIVSIINPVFIVPRFTIRGQVLVLFPSLVQTIQTIEAALVGKASEPTIGLLFDRSPHGANAARAMSAWSQAPKRAAPSRRPARVRLEIWSKDAQGNAGRLVAKVAEYQPRAVVQRKKSGDTVVLVSVAKGGAGIVIERASAPPAAGLGTKRP
jgi:hypothetical protein